MVLGVFSYSDAALADTKGCLCTPSPEVGQILLVSAAFFFFSFIGFTEELTENFQ